MRWRDGAAAPAAGIARGGAHRRRGGSSLPSVHAERLREAEASAPPDLSEEVTALRAECADLTQRLGAAEAAAAGAANRREKHASRAAADAADVADEFAAASADLEAQLRATESALEEERLAARRAARARAREAKAERDELTRAQAQLRELRSKNRHLTAVPFPALPALVPA